MTAQLQELRASSLLEIFAPLEKDQGRGVGHCSGVYDGRDMGECPEYVATLLAQALMICTTPGGETIPTTAHSIH